MIKKQGLEFRRRDLMTFDFDQFLQSIHDKDVMAVIDVADIPRLQPGVFRQGGSRRGRVSPVTFHDVGGADPEFATGVEGEFKVGGVAGQWGGEGGGEGHYGD